MLNRFKSSLIATGLYTISFPELANIRLIEIGKIPITISILALCIGFGFGILHYEKINKSIKWEKVSPSDQARTKYWKALKHK